MTTPEGELDGDSRRRGSYVNLTPTEKVASIVLHRMREEGATEDEAEEYLDSLIAQSRANHPDFDDNERWAEVRRVALASITSRLTASN